MRFCNLVLLNRVNLTDHLTGIVQSISNKILFLPVFRWTWVLRRSRGWHGNKNSNSYTKNRHHWSQIHWRKGVSTTTLEAAAATAATNPKTWHQLYSTTTSTSCRDLAPSIPLGTPLPLLIQPSWAPLVA